MSAVPIEDDAPRGEGHGLRVMTSRRVAIILFNLGGPDTQEAVRPFLFNLFSDKAEATEYIYPTLIYASEC